MTDTPEHIAQIQFEINRAKSIPERFEIWQGMMSFVRQAAIARIKKRCGNDISESQLTYELIKEYYGAELGENTLTDIKKRLKL